MYCSNVTSSGQIYGRDLDQAGNGFWSKLKDGPYKGSAGLHPDDDHVIGIRTQGVDMLPGYTHDHRQWHNSNGTLQTRGESTSHFSPAHHATHTLEGGVLTSEVSFTAALNDLSTAGLDSSSVAGSRGQADGGGGRGCGDSCQGSC